VLSHLIWKIHSALGHAARRPSIPRLLPPRNLLADEGGAIYVEYIILTLFVAIGFSVAVIGIGVPLLQMFRMTQLFLAAPVP